MSRKIKNMPPKTRLSGTSDNTPDWVKATSEKLLKEMNYDILGALSAEEVFKLVKNRFHRKIML